MLGISDALHLNYLFSQPQIQGETLIVFKASCIRLHVHVNVELFVTKSNIFQYCRKWYILTQIWMADFTLTLFSQEDWLYSFETVEGFNEYSYSMPSLIFLFNVCHQGEPCYCEFNYTAILHSLTLPLSHTRPYKFYSSQSSFFFFY